jgi:rare lipoprotein A
MKNINIFVVIITIMLLSACSNSRYRDKHDSIPTRLPNQSELQDALPRAESYSRGGNKNYQVRGINYKVLANAKNFEQTGIASWYGKKFHGHLTSNGEIYDMYSMSAAHKNLPLPTYLKVTNLDNNKSVIVRVNDRGPFHPNRIIDLSYSAAYKLDMLQYGTAKVKITAITTLDDNTAQDNASVMETSETEIIAADNTVTNTTIASQLLAKTLAEEKNYIQVFATSKHELAQEIAKNIATRYSQTVKFPNENGIYRIQIGPIMNQTTLNKLLLELKEGNYPNAYLVGL